MVWNWLNFSLRVMVAAGACYGLFVVLVNHLGKQAWFLRLIGIEVLRLSHSDIEVLGCDIQEAVSDYVKAYIEGDSHTFDISLYTLNQAFGSIVSDEYLMDFIDEYVILDERIELFEVIEGRLVLEINSEVLKDCYAKKVMSWKCEGQLDRIAYYEGEGRL